MSLVEPLAEGEKGEEEARWSDCQSAWDRLQATPEDERSFLEHLLIAHDCGLSEIGTKEELWYPSRYVTGAMLLLFVVQNTYFIFVTDLHGYFDPAPTYHEYLLSKSISQKFGMDNHFLHKSPQKVVFIVECALLLGMLFNACRLLWLAIYSKKPFKKWNATKDLFWYSLVDLSSFSAIKLLQFVTPQQLSYDLNYIIFYEPAKTKKLKLLFFMVSTPCILLVGLDCFLIKVRLAQSYVDSFEGSLMNVMGSFVLLIQILGVVQISKTIKNRLYRFVFAGEDGMMTEDEQVRQDVWEAMVVQQIFKKYPLDKALALMLTWCDDDFQMMALNEDEQKKK